MFPSSTKVFNAVRRIKQHVANIKTINQEIRHKSNAFLNRDVQDLTCITITMYLAQDIYTDACLIFTSAVCCFSRQQMAAYKEQILAMECSIATLETKLLEVKANVYEVI
jgi:hypothetical protein